MRGENICPSSAGEGRAATSRNGAKLPSCRGWGGVGQVLLTESKELFDQHHPIRSIKEASRLSLVYADCTSSAEEGHLDYV